MAPDILNERRLTIPAAARKAGVSPGCSWRWVLYGIKGGTLKLRSALIGGKRYTSEEALAEFVAACNGTTTPPARTSRQRERAIEAAERELAESGI